MNFETWQLNYIRGAAYDVKIAASAALVMLAMMLAVPLPTQAQLTVLHTFAGYNGPDGANPSAGLSMDTTTGYLYGTTVYGGKT